MRQKLIIILLLVTAGWTLMPTVLIAQGATESKNVLSGISCIKDGNCNLCDFMQIFVNVADIIVGLTGVVAIVMFVYGGIVLMTSYGNENRVRWGKDAIIATVVGIFLVMIAWTLVNTVILSLYGGTSGSFATFMNLAGYEETDNWNMCPK